MIVFLVGSNISRIRKVKKQEKFKTNDETELGDTTMIDSSFEVLKTKQMYEATSKVSALNVKQ